MQAASSKRKERMKKKLNKAEQMPLAGKSASMSKSAVDED